MLHLDKRLDDEELSLLAPSGGTIARIHVGALPVNLQVENKTKQKKEPKT